MRRRLPLILIASFTVGWLLAGCGGSGPEAATDAATAADRIVVTSLDQLPQHTYPIEGTASELFADREAFVGFAAAVGRDVEADLARYELDDASTLKGWYGTLANVAMLEGRWDDALDYMRRSRALEVKEDARLTAGQVGEAMIAAYRQSDSHLITPEVRRAFREELSSRVQAWPWDVVQDVVEQRKGQAEYMSPNLLAGVVQMQHDPVVAKSGELGSDLARGLVGLKVDRKSVV
jgi:hypothetical protein